MMQQTNQDVLNKANDLIMKLTPLSGAKGSHNLLEEEVQNIWTDRSNMFPLSYSSPPSFDPLRTDAMDAMDLNTLMKVGSDLYEKTSMPLS